MNALGLYEKFSRFPFGRAVYSRIFCWKAPYFGTIRPLIAELQSGHCVVTMRKRRRVLNHLGSVHAIAMCNLAEAAGGLCTEVTLCREFRWIPKGMAVEYLRKATTDLRATCRIDPGALGPGEREVLVEVGDATGCTVFRARILMYVSPRKS